MATSGRKVLAALLFFSLCLLDITALLQGPKCGFPQVKSLLERSLRIVGGAEAVYGSHPWLVSLKSKGMHFCGASILTDRWLVTAAHCLYTMSNDILQNVSAVIGEHNQRVSDQDEQRFRLKTLRIHEKFWPVSPLNYDIALLELDGFIQFDKHVQPLCLPLPSETFPPGTSCSVGGWGRERERGPLPAVLREVSLDLVDTGRCKHALQSLRPQPQPHTVVCAGPERGGRDACQGDSGGPLVCPREDGHWVVVGVTSWGKGCGRSWIDNALKQPRKRGSPGVFTDVKAFLPWIKRILKESDLTPISSPLLCHVMDGALTENHGVISNPEKPVKNYTNNEMCSWSITVPTGRHILLEFLEFDLENDTLCHNDQLTVFEGASRVIGRFCGNQLPGPVLVPSSSVTIQFVSDASDTRAGFTIQYKAVDEDFQLEPRCGTLAMNQAQGAIQSPRYPEAYGEQADCRWVIHAPKGHVVKLDFHDFDVEQSQYCQYDSLRIFGDVDGQHEIAVLCGSAAPPPVLSYASVMVLHFTSDSSVTARGFHATPTFIRRSELQDGQEKRDLEDESEGTSPHTWQAQTEGLPGLCGMQHSLAGSGLGEGTLHQHWPWGAQLHVGTEVISLGAIIQPDWVLTAAHRVHSLDEETLGSLTVKTGDPDKQIRRVKSVLVHPEYDPSSLDSDVALLQLDSDFTLTNHTQLICLPSLPQDGTPSLYCKVPLESRYPGSPRNNASLSVDVSLLERADCERYYPQRLANTMLCTQHKDLNDPCMDRSGAPLACHTNDSHFFVLGVASQGEGCGKFPRPAVYSSLLPVVNWILEQLDMGLNLVLEEDPEENDIQTESSGYFY